MLLSVLLADLTNKQAEGYGVFGLPEVTELVVSEMFRSRPNFIGQATFP